MNEENKIPKFVTDLTNYLIAIKNLSQVYVKNMTITIGQFLEFINIHKLKNKYEKIVNEYLQIFIEKQGFDADDCYWIGNKIGEILSVNEQYHFSFDDIRFDVDNNVEAGAIIDWQDESIDNYFKKKKHKVNYENYLKLNGYE